MDPWIDIQVRTDEYFCKYYNTNTTNTFVTALLKPENEVSKANRYSGEVRPQVWVYVGGKFRRGWLLGSPSAYCSD